MGQSSTSPNRRGADWSAAVLRRDFLAGENIYCITITGNICVAHESMLVGQYPHDHFSKEYGKEQVTYWSAETMQPKLGTNKNELGSDDRVAALLTPHPTPHERRMRDG